MPDVPRFERLATAAAVAIVLGLGWFLVTRPGYSPDEEITVFAVRGVLSTGLPVMPSGWRYWRGTFYSYVAAAAAAVTGETLQTSRAVSLASAALAVVGISAVGRRVVGSGGTAALLLAVWPATAALSGYARFYAPFVALYVLALLSLARVQRDRRAVWWFVAAAVVARALQEFAVSLVLIPMIAALSSERADDRRRFAVCTVATTAAVGLTHMAMTLSQAPLDSTVSQWGFNSLGLPATTAASLPGPGLVDTADLLLLFVIFVSIAIWLRSNWRADALFILAAACAATMFALGTIIAIIVCSVIVKPARAAQTSLGSLLLLVVAAGVWLVVIALRTDIAMSPALAFDLLVASVRFPFSGAQRLLLELPMLTALTTAGIAWTLWTTRSAGDMSVIARAFACTLWLHVLAIGVFDVDLRVRYFAMTCPLLAVFAAVAPTAFMLRARQLRRLVAAGALAFTGVTMATTVWEQHRFTRAQVERPAPRWWGVWAPPVAQGALDDHHAPPIGPDDIVISNDELAGVWRLGRVDYWAAPDPAAELLSFVAPDGVRRGRYAASQVLQGADEVRTVVAARGARSVSVVLFETGKFGVTPADRASIAELATVQQLVSDDWTLMRWTAVR